MNVQDTTAVQTVLDALALGARGSVPLAAVALASDEALLALAAAAPNTPMAEIVSSVCGPLSGAAYASIWLNRPELLELIEAAKTSAPTVLATDLSLAELSALAAGSFEYLKSLACTHPAAAADAVMLWDPEVLANEFALAAVGLDLCELLAQPALTVDEQVAVAGLLMLEPRHPFAVSAFQRIDEPWRSVAAFLGDTATDLIG
jgi:hypothetical protein